MKRAASRRSGMARGGARTLDGSRRVSQLGRLDSKTLWPALSQAPPGSWSPRHNTGNLRYACTVAARVSCSDVLQRTKWRCENASDYWDGLPVIARGVPKPGYWPDGPDFGEARVAPGAVPERDTAR